MKPNSQNIDFLLMATGFTYSIANIEQVLGIIILIIQIIWFSLKLYIKFKEISKYTEDKNDESNSKS